MEAEKSVQYRPLKQRLFNSEVAVDSLCAGISHLYLIIYPSLKSQQSSRVSALTIHAVPLETFLHASEVLSSLPRWPSFPSNQRKHIIKEDKPKIQASKIISSVVLLQSAKSRYEYVVRIYHTGTMYRKREGIMRVVHTSIQKIGRLIDMDRICTSTLATLRKQLMA
jgi:hypothetical protein